MLSDKKYIQTQARKLPIYKCFVNSDWSISKMANVFVLRKHVNGNITAGIYLVDLLCLGIKDTFFVFNENENIFLERYESMGVELLEIDYTTAHNIIFAGHDFAMEYEIPPHKDFALTKMILEEDNDDIPLIDIEVGAPDGKPHLMVYQAGEFIQALAKLKKNAGEGNYYYTVRENDFDEDDDEEDDDESDDTEEDYSEFMDEFDSGEIDAYNVQYIRNEDLRDSNKVLQRDQFEIIAIQVELLLRLLEQTHPVYFFDTDVMDREEYELIEDAEGVPENIPEESYLQCGIHLDEIQEKSLIKNDSEVDSEILEDGYINDLNEHAHNKMLPVVYLEIGTLGKFEKLVSHLKQKLELLKTDYPIYAIYLTLEEMISEPERTESSHLDLSGDLSILFPNVDYWSFHELKTWFLAQVLYYTRKNDIKMAIYYYQLSAETEIVNFMESLVQSEFSNALTKMFLSEEDKGKKGFLRIVK